MAGIYGYGQIAIGDSTNFTELCSGGFQFNQTQQNVVTRFYNATQQMWEETIHTVGNREYSLNVSVDLINEAALLLFFGSPVLEVIANQEVVFSGTFFMFDNRQAIISSSRCVPTGIGSISPGQPISIDLQILDLPRVNLIGA